MSIPNSPIQNITESSEIHQEVLVGNSGINVTENNDHSMSEINPVELDEESLVRKTQNISIYPSSVSRMAEKRTTEETIEGLDIKRKQLVQEYTDSFNSEMNPEGYEDKLIFKIDSITKHIETLQRSITKPTNSAYKLTSVDLPGFQLKHQKDLPFPNKPQFDSVAQFLRQFEKVIEAGGYNVVLVWKKFIPLSLSLDLDAWLTGDLLICETWDKAKELFQKKFGNSFAKVEARRTVFNMRMGYNESIKEYYLRFTKSTSEAGYNKEDTTLGDVFYNSLPASWQTQIGTVLISRGINEDNYTIDHIFDASNSIYGDKTPKDVPGTMVMTDGRQGYQEKRRYEQGETSGHHKRRQVKDNKVVAVGSFFCSKHGGDKATHNEKDCFSNNNKPKFLGNNNRPFKATNNTKNNFPCDYCGKQWFHGHKCQEFYDSKNKEKLGNKKIFHIKRSEKQVDSDVIMEDNVKQVMAEENDAYDCKYIIKETKEADPFKLITPIILEGIKLVAKIDTGSEISCINQYILNKHFNHIKINNCKGQLTFLAIDD
jgi:hypothetical protein